ncbi:hypothetical protein Ct61P_14638 [Colletotrichum tofieldiae]|nr:hypothetical protein Ct61P_14638 [Colletotrichum tofieldiae]
MRVFRAGSQGLDNVSDAEDADVQVGWRVAAANMLMNATKRSVHDANFLPALRGELGGYGSESERAQAGLSKICGWGAV